jgi:hypothetical protein
MLTHTQKVENTKKESCQEAELLMKAGLESIANGLQRISLASTKIENPSNIFQKIFNLLLKTKRIGSTIQANNK